jgi:hypothetical protein
MGEATKDLCEMRHRQITEKFKEQDDRFEENETEIRSLRDFKIGTELEMKNLIEQIKRLISMMTWFFVTAFGTLLGFFIWYIQSKI